MHIIMYIFMHMCIEMTSADNWDRKLHEQCIVIDCYYYYLCLESDKDKDCVGKTFKHVKICSYIIFKYNFIRYRRSWANFPTWCCHHCHYFFCHSVTDWSYSVVTQASSLLSWLGELDGIVFICSLYNICVIWIAVWLSLSRVMAVAAWGIGYVYSLASYVVVSKEVSTHWHLCCDVCGYFLHFHEDDPTFHFVCCFIWSSILYAVLSTSKIWVCCVHNKYAWCVRTGGVCMYVCMHVRIYVCVYMYVCT